MYYNKKKGNRRNTYYVKAYSKRCYQWWTEQTLTDFEMFLNETQLLKEFIRGFFESEGSYYKRDYPNYQTFCQMVNTELAIIHLFKKALLKLSFKTSIHRHEEKRKGRKKFVYKLWILGGKNEHNRFIQLIKPCIKNRLH
jgi:intein-encoded DNA endonuclease-like protein